VATTKAFELGQLGSKLTIHSENITLDGNVHGQYAGFDSDINASSIGDLSNVDITTSAPSNNQSLIWDNANSKFVPGDSFSQSDFNTAFGNKSTSDLSEGTNEYHTTARARSSISATGSLSYNSSTGVMSFTQGNTDTISEGSSNLYYTDARADARVSLIVDAAPGTLNTLNELAAALGDDANFSTTVTNSIATKLPLAGGTLTGDVLYGDSVKAKFGAGSDLQIYHDQYNSYVSQTGTGDLRIQNNVASKDVVIIAENGSGGRENYIRADGSARNVQLSFQGAVKFSTTSTGISVAGDVAVSGTVDGRDVATDGTKLDGIEAGATADQTKADIDALNINANTLDGRQGYQYVFDGLDNGATDIMVNDADFVVRDTTDSITNFLWRDHSASKLYLGTADAQPTTRYDLYTQGGSKYFHAGNDGAGSGLDADTVDGIQGSSFLRSDADDTMNGKLTINYSTHYKGIHLNGNNAPCITFVKGVTSTPTWRAGISGYDGAAFAISTGASVGDRLHIKNSGDVGIGTTSPSERLHVSGNILLTGNLVGSSTTTEIGQFGSNSVGAIKRIRMTQGGELHFGDTTTTNFLGITEGTVNQFSDTDRLGIYYRNELKLYSNTNTLRVTFDASGNILATGNVTATAFLGDGSQLTGISGAAASFVTYSSAPSVPAAGGVYYNTTEDKAYISNGTVWAPFTNSPPEPTSGTRSLSGTNGSSFSHNLDTDFTDDQPITNASYTHNTGSLPPGVSISGNLLSGTPTSTGTYTFGISGRDALGADGTDKSYSFVVNALPFAGSGGSVSYSGGYTYHTFTSSGNFTVSGEVSKTVDYLIVAGGGGGGTDRYQDRSGGGGGAGGMLSGTRSTGSGTYSAVIGGGGAGDSSGNAGGDGSNSSLSSFGSTAIGGGGGAGHTNMANTPGRSGGSGGGGTHDNNAGPPGSGTSGQGNSGAYSNNPQGGAGAQWVNGSYYAGGGAGSQGSIYVGGGGGGKSTSGTSGSFNGGTGGGGNSGSSTGVVNGGAGSSNTGGGGGAGRESTAGAGGSGVVIVRYQT